MIHIINRVRSGGYYLYYLPTILTVIFLVLMPPILSSILTSILIFINFFIPVKYPDWLTLLFIRILAIPYVVVDFLLSRGFLPGTKDLYLDPISSHTALSMYVGFFVILAGTFFINLTFPLCC